MAPSPMCDSAVSPCFRGCLAFLHRHFPPLSPPSHPLDLSLTVNSSPRPGIAPQFLNSSSQPLPLPGDRHSCLGCGKDRLVLIPLRLPQISCFFLSLKCFSFDSDNCPTVGMGSLLQFHHLLRAGPVLLTLVFPPSSFVLPSFAWLCILFSSGQVLLSTLSWCSGCTSVSEGVFLIYLWRDVLHIHLFLCHLFLSQIISRSLTQN